MSADIGWPLNKFIRGWMLTAVITGLALSAALSVTKMVANTLDETGGVDFHTYWYYNHFVRQGDDPYEAYHHNRDVRLPVNYVDGRETTSYPISSGVSVLHPANTPITLFFIHPFSYLSWPTAKLIWMILNIAMVLTTPWLVFRLLPVRLGPALQVITAFFFYGMIGTRAAVGTGQTSIVVFFFILLTIALLRREHRWLAGLAFGVALSKFTLGAALGVYLLYKKHWLTAGVGIFVQLLGFMGVILLRRGDPMDVFSDYAAIVAVHASFSGIHLTGLFPPTATVIALVGLFFSLAVWTPLLLSLSRYKAQWLEPELGDFTVFSVICLWALLAVYHRPYDIGVVLLPMTLLLAVLKSRTSWGLTVSQAKWLLVLWLGSLVILSVPAKVIEGVAGAWWDPFLRGAISVDLLALLLACLLLLWQVRRFHSGNTGSTAAGPGRTGLYPHTGQHPVL